eukprot:8734745-Pyramimonas_sp.AAC.1
MSPRWMLRHRRWAGSSGPSREVSARLGRILVLIQRSHFATDGFAAWCVFGRRSPDSRCASS